METENRVIQQVSDLGWIDFDLDVPAILPYCFAHSAYLCSLGRSEQTVKQPKSKTNQPRLNHPVDLLLCIPSAIRLFPRFCKMFSGSSTAVPAAKASKGEL